MPHSTRTHEPSPSIATTPFTPFGSEYPSIDGPTSGDRLKHDCQSRDVRSDNSRSAGAGGGRSSGGTHVPSKRCSCVVTCEEESNGEYIEDIEDKGQS